MTAVDLIQPAGRPMDLTAVMDKQGFKAARPETGETRKTGFGFGDFIDVINPLQHIPGVAEIYRSVTNDRISDDARKAGNVLYGFALGGPVGVGAMMAYNAVGDRMNGAQEPQPTASQQVAEIVPSTDLPEPDTPPVPTRKPDVEPAPVSNAARETALLGTSVAAAGQGTRSTPPLAGLLNGTQSPGDAAVGKAPETSASATAASSVAYVDVREKPGETAAVIPSEAGLDRLATHQSNRLPLDVLKALQERHAERTASERS